MSILAFIVFSLLLGYLVGHSHKDIQNKLKTLIEREDNSAPAIINPLPPQEIQYRTSSIVTPMSPAEVELAQEREVERKIREAGDR